MRYKIGDKVKIKEGLKTTGFSVSIVSDMLEYRGQIVKVINATRNNEGREIYTMKNTPFHWDVDWIESVICNKGRINIQD